MDLSVFDRKKLWANAAGLCSYQYAGEICSRKLFTDAGEIDSNIGEECHISGEKSDAARYLENFPNRETYENAILMCRNHHKVIDDTQDIFTIDYLKKMKESHEQSVAKKLQNGDIRPFILKDVDFSLEVEDAKKAIGMDIAHPTSFSNVKVKVQAKNVEDVTGIRFNAGMTVGNDFCPKCGTLVPYVFGGQSNHFEKTCPNCRYTFS